MAEYPNLNMVGEEWSKLPAVVSHWQRGKVNFNGYVSSMPSLMDFPLTEAMRTRWPIKTVATAKNIFNDVYETLSLDYLYPDPQRLVLFESNHDMARIYSVVGEDLDRWKMDFAFVMTMPRIPHFYTGDEILMTSETRFRDDNSYRHDFPGGWAGDKVNAFTGAGLTDARARSPGLRAQAGQLAQEQPRHPSREADALRAGEQYLGLLPLRRHKKVMVALNANDKETVLEAERFHEMLSGVASGTDVMTGKTYSLEGRDQVAGEFRADPRNLSPP
jgi:glycosidase